MRKAISRRCEALIKPMAGHQDAGGGISRASASLVRHLGQGRGGGAPARWNRTDGERTPRSCMPSSPSLAEGDT